MAVYDHGYKGYDGPLMPARSRFLVISRYGLREVFASRLFLAFFASVSPGRWCCSAPCTCATTRRRWP